MGLFPFASLQIDNLLPRPEFLCVVVETKTATDSRYPLMPIRFVHGKSLGNVEAGFCWVLLIDCRGHIKVRRSLIVLWFGTLLVGCLVHAIPVECLLPDLSIKVNFHGQPLQDRTLGELYLLLEVPGVHDFDRVFNGVVVINSDAVIAH